MSIEFYVLVIPFCAIPVCLVSLDYLNKSAELEKKKHNVIDFDKFIKRKEEGDFVEEEEEEDEDEEEEEEDEDDDEERED
tara:strand:- start:259 stop:498 length:240 start_codon:yes stop_codon:yes gene_type:complete